MSEFLPEVIKGNFNQDVIKTLLFVKENLGVNNPIYIYGPHGIGKTFTIKSFLSYFSEGNYIKADKINKDILKELGKYQMLAIDDFHLISTESNIQSLIIDLMDEWIENKKQIILIADRGVEKLLLEEGLKSRLSGGGIIEFKPLDESSIHKIIDIMGENIPEVLREPLYKKPWNDIRKIEGEIKKLRILGKAEISHIGGKKTEEDFNGFINSLRSEFPENIEIVSKKSEAERLREEYKDKMYVWQMKGFKIDSLKEVVDNGTIEEITSAFVSFTTNVQRLIELHRRFGMLDRRYFPVEADEIEERLFDPDSVMFLEEKISQLEHKIALKRKFSGNFIFDKTIDKIVVSDANKEIYEYLNLVLSSPFEGEDPIIIVGGRGTGKTHLLNAFAQEMTKRYPHLLVAYLPFHLFLAEGKGIKTIYGDVDVLFIDDLHHIVERGWIEDITFIITKLLKRNKRIVISTAKSPKFLRLLGETKELLAKGKTFYLSPPDKNIKVAMAEKIIQDMDIEKKDIDVNIVADKVQGGYYDIDAYIFSLVEKLPKGESAVEISEKEMKEEASEVEQLPLEQGVVKLEEVIHTEKELPKIENETPPSPVPTEKEKEEKKVFDEGIDIKLDDYKGRIIEEI